jgi:GTP-binding protein HflX
MAMEPRIDRNDKGEPIAVWLSAQTGAGCDLLLQAIAERLGEEMVFGQLLLQANQGRLRAMLYQQQAIANEHYRDDGSSELELRIPKNDLLRILSAESLVFEQLNWVVSG